MTLLKKLDHFKLKYIFFLLLKQSSFFGKAAEKQLSTLSQFHQHAYAQLSHTQMLWRSTFISPTILCPTLRVHSTRSYTQLLSSTFNASDSQPGCREQVLGVPPKIGLAVFLLIFTALGALDYQL